MLIRLVRRLVADLSLSAVVAGFVAMLVGYSSSVAIVFQAARAVGAGPAETTSWLWALGIGMGVTCLGLALWFRFRFVVRISVVFIGTRVLLALVVDRLLCAMVCGPKGPDVSD